MGKRAQMFVSVELGKVLDLMRFISLIFEMPREVESYITPNR